jgi:putative membrane protein
MAMVIIKRQKILFADSSKLCHFFRAFLHDKIKNKLVGGGKMEITNHQKNYTKTVVSLSIVINAIILLLFFSPIGYRGDIDFDLTIFPRMNAIFNSFTFVFLLSALFAIKKKNIKVHRNFIFAAFTTTGLFFVSYLTYHYLQSEPTHYGGEGFMKAFYYFILITHSFLAAVIVPLALFAFFWAYPIKWKNIGKLSAGQCPFGCMSPLQECSFTC